MVTRLRGAAARQQGPAASPATQGAAAREAAQEASAAAPSPSGEARSQAQAAQAEVMSRQRPGEVNQRTFRELVEERLNAVPTPRNPEEMDRFRQQGGAQGLRQQLEGQVGESAAQAQHDIRSAATAQPAAGEARRPEPLPPPGSAPRPAEVRPQEGLPTPRPAQEVSLEGSRRQVEDRMRQDNLTDEQLREANDTRFDAVRRERESVHEHAARAPEEYRAAEQAELQRQETAVARDERETQQQMRAEREGAEGQIATRQRQAMTREEAERRQVSERIEAIFTAAQQRVQEKLTWLDGEVDRRFTSGEERARRSFEQYVETEMRNWKIRRYGMALLIPGVGAAIALGRWIADKLTDINRFPEVRQIYEDAKRVYVREMRAVIADVSGVVESSLGWCAGEIRRARGEIQDYVQSLPQALRRVGDETARGVNERFDQLRNTVNERREALANRLVERYRQAQQQLDARLRQMQEANRGLVNRFVAAVREVVEIIRNFRRQLMGLIGEARDVVDRIVQRPVRFVGNLVRALRTGFDQFSRNITRHLRGALLNWLFGALSSAGINVPPSFDLRSIGGLILQVLGITTARLRAKVAGIIGERNMAILENAWRYVSTLVREGPIGLWNEIRQDLSNLWDMALQSIREWVISQIVRAAVTRLVSMFNPAGAIIQAALAIYNAVMFFVEKIQQIMELVRTVVRSLDRIERGQIADAANWVENAMARTLPIIIGFLARLLGLSGISDRVREFIERIQARVDRAIDAALARVLQAVRRLLGGGRGAAAGAPAIPDVERPATLGRERHTLKFHTENGRATLLMASGRFEPLLRKLPLIVNSYTRGVAQQPGSTDLTPQLRQKVQEITDRAAALERQVSELQARGIRDMNNALLAQADQIKHNGQMELSRKIEELGQFSFGPGHDVKPGDIVVLPATNESRYVDTVKNIMPDHDIGLYIKSPDPSVGPRRPLLYRGYGPAGQGALPKWEKASGKPSPLAPFDLTGKTRKMQTDYSLYNKGTGPTTWNPPGLVPPWDKKGHMIALVLGGRGERRNILALTEGANSTRSNSMFLGMERHVRDDIKKNPSIYNYESEADETGTAVPGRPTKIKMRARKIWPAPATNPPTVPTSYDVDNVP